MTIFSSEFLGWNLLSSRFLIGTYYGMLATLPLTPSQLLSIRVLLLEDENTQGKIIGAGAAKGIFIAGVSGFLIAQFAMFLSIYCLPLYTVWFKPHVFNLCLPPLLLWHYFKIIEFDPVAHLIPNYKHPFLDPRVRTTFLESFLFQIINPIVLPNPVFTRLMSLFLFRYSHIPIFVFGSLLGWLSGQFLFIILSRILLSRLEIDSPSIYRMVKRVLHLAFPPIVVGICLSYIGRVSMVPFYKKTYRKKKLKLSKLWPDICYNRNRVSRSIHFMLSSHKSKVRGQPNAPFNTLNKPFNKRHFSQYFFNVCISDGKQRLIHNYPISVSLIQRELTTILNNNKNNVNDNDIIFQQWANNQEVRFIHFNEAIKNTLNNFDQGIEGVIEKRVHSLNEGKFKFYRVSKYIKKNISFKKKISYPNNLSELLRKYIKSRHILGNRIRKSYDSRLGTFLRNKSNRSKKESFWCINDHEDYELTPVKNRNYLARWKIETKRLNRLKTILSKLNIYNRYFSLRKRIPRWKSRSKSSSFYYQFEFFKENLTRRRRRRYIARSLLHGATYGRSRNITGMFQLLETKPRSPFFLRAKEITIDSKDKQDSKQRSSQIESEKFDFVNSHSIRGPALITQAFIRKYVKLPTLILGKSLVRLLLIQPSEWNEDWAEWAQEQYIYCFYNGNYVPNNKLPSYWLADGLQIKIWSPCYLKPWRPSTSNKDLTLASLDKMLIKSSYINIWGQETDVPFGEVLNTPFFRPMLKGSILFVRYELAKMLRVLNRVSLYLQKQCTLITLFVHQMTSVFHQKPEKNTSNLKILDQKSILVTDSHLYEPINELTNGEKAVISLEKTELAITKSSQKKTNENKWNKNQVQSYLLVENSKNILQKNMFEPNNIIISIDSDIENQNNYQFSTQPSLIKSNLKYEALSVLPIDLVLKKPKKFLEYQKVKIRIFGIQLFQKWILLKKYTTRVIINFIRISYIAQLQFRRDIMKLPRRVILTCSKQTYTAIIKLTNFIKCSSLFDRVDDSNTLKTIDNNRHREESYSLSHAYILDKIWQSNMPNRLSIHNLLVNWKTEYVLEDHLKMILNQQGLLNNQNTQDINLHIFQEWLKPFRRYVPSPEIWHQISPHIWRKVVSEFWTNTNFTDHFKYKKKNYQNNTSFKYLSYYKPLFEKANKMNKRWQLHLLTNSYTDSLKNGNLYNILSGWQNKNREQTQLFRFQLVNDKYALKKFISTYKSLRWGLANAKANGLAPSFKFKKSFYKSFSPKNMTYMSLRKPIYYKYKNTMFLEFNEFDNLKERVSFEPICQYRWKSEQQRWKALNSLDTVKKAKLDLKNAARNLMRAQRYNIKSVPICTKQLQEATLRWKTISLSRFFCKKIKKRQAKVLDDEMIMHSIIGSFLRFKNRYFNNRNLGLLDPSFNQFLFTKKLLFNSSFLIPEDILLSRSLREYRILTYLHFGLQSSLSNMVKTKNSQNELQQHANTQYMDMPYVSTQSTIALDGLKQSDSSQIIKRYIWPTYRVEDLACMNRFWINTANQSRFSSLRIRIYPNLSK